MQARFKKAYQEIEANDRFWRSDEDILKLLQQGEGVLAMSSKLNGYALKLINR